MAGAGILGLRTCIYMVPDLPAAIEWYNRAFDAEPYFNEPFYVGYNIGGYELGLQPDPAGNGPKSENIYTYWGVADIEVATSHFKALGAEVMKDPYDVGEGIMVVDLKDPWGNVIGLIYNPNFKLPASTA